MQEIQYDETLTVVAEKTAINKSKDHSKLEFHIASTTEDLELIGKHMKIRYVLAVIIDGKYDDDVKLNKSVSCLYSTGKYKLNGVDNLLITGKPVSSSDEKAHTADHVQYVEKLDKTIALFQCFSLLPELSIKEEYTELGKVDVELNLAQRFPQLSDHTIHADYEVLFPTIRWLSCSFQTAHNLYSPENAIEIIEHIENKKSEH